MFQKICHSGEGGVEDDVAVHQLKNAVDFIQPLRYRHIGIVNGFQVADKGLKEVVVGVDKTGIDEHLRGVNHLIAGIGEILTDLCDLWSLNQQIRVLIDAILSVASDDGSGVADQRGFHHSVYSFFGN